MKHVFQILGRTLRACIGVLGSFGLWSLWLVLAIALIVQIYVATTQELAVPQFVLQKIESRLAAAGLRATFSRTSFDPTGRILIENARLSPVALAEPVAQVRALYVRLNPWMLMVGQVEPREIRINGATAIIPTMLSGTGQPEEIVRDLDATFLPGDRHVIVEHLSARVSGIAVSVHGTMPLPRASREPTDSWADFFSQHFPGICRQVMSATGQLAGLDSATVNLHLLPAESGEPGIDVTVLARGVNLPPPIAFQGRELRVESRLLLLNGAPSLTRIDGSAGELMLPQAGGIVVRNVKATAHGRLEPTSHRFEARQVELVADSLEAAGVAVDALSGDVRPRPPSRLDAQLAGRIAGAPMSVRAETDLKAKSAALRFDGSVSPQILEAIAQRTNIDVKRFFDFTSLDVQEGEAELGPEWKFERAGARIVLGKIKGYGVTFDEGRARIEFDGKRFHAPEAFARIGENFAHGSYEQDFGTNRYRFLLSGRLRPMDISPWFQPWWPSFFQQLEFPSAPPIATVDVNGVWRDGRQSAVFVHADAARPIVRGAALTDLHTRLFIRPGFFDGLDIVAKHDSGALRGTFTYALDPATRTWRTFDFEADSSLDLAVARQIGGPDAIALLNPFKLANAPELRMSGHFDGPASPAGRRRDFRIRASTAGDFRFQNFPLQDVSFTAALNDDEIVVDKVEARFGGGTTTGRARVWGADAARRVSFDFALKDAGLGQAAASLEEFLAAQNSRPPAPPGKYVQEKASVRIDLAASAEGSYANLRSYRGQGTAALHGSEIGQVPLLGALSELLKFTALRLTSANATFRIEGPKLVFPEITLRGSDAAIDAHGDYSLDGHQFDFNAKLFPFQESGNLIKTVVGAVLTPLSNAFEVKLSGTIANPEWRMVLGPSNLLRSLAPDERQPEKREETPPASSPVPAPAAETPRPVPPS